MSETTASDMEVADGPAAAVAERTDGSGQQQELPLAFVHGKALTVLPRDLYIPPDALEVFLEAFEGPLDLLLYLIRRQNLDILEINVAEITEQYIQYVELIDAMNFELAAEYLVMAAMLAEIKSRMLLPRPESGVEDEADPRADLIRRLQEYEQFKQAAEDIDALTRLDRDVHLAAAEPPELRHIRPQPGVDLRELLLAFAEVVHRAAVSVSHHVQFEKLSTRERMSEILARLQRAPFVPFVSLFRVEEGRMGVVVSFLAIMELIKEALVEIVQSEPFGPIHVKARGQDAIDAIEIDP
jgi:segregation and condensation protein A